MATWVASAWLLAAQSASWRFRRNHGSAAETDGSVTPSGNTCTISCVRRRLPVVLSAVALVVAVFGSTPLGEAAGRLLQAVPPFAKKADYANRAGRANFARTATSANNAKLLAGHRASAVAAPGVVPVAGPDGKLATTFGSIGPAGPAGPQGPPIDTAKLLGRTTIVTASRSVTTTYRFDFVLCPTGYEAVGGGAYQDNYRAVSGSMPPIFLLATGPVSSAGSFLGDGTSGPAAGWGAMIVRASGPADTVHWSAVCAKEGA